MVGSAVGGSGTASNPVDAASDAASGTDSKAVSNAEGAPMEAH